MHQLPKIQQATTKIEDCSISCLAHGFSDRILINLSPSGACGLWLSAELKLAQTGPSRGLGRRSAANSMPDNEDKDDSLESNQRERSRELVSLYIEPETVFGACDPAHTQFAHTIFAETAAMILGENSKEGRTLLFGITVPEKFLAKNQQSDRKQNDGSEEPLRLQREFLAKTLELIKKCSVW